MEITVRGGRVGRVRIGGNRSEDNRNQDRFLTSCPPKPIPVQRGRNPNHCPTCVLVLPFTGAHTYSDVGLSGFPAHLTVHESPSLPTLMQSVLSHMVRSSISMGLHLPHTGWLGGGWATHVGVAPAIREKKSGGGSEKL